MHLTPARARGANLGMSHADPQEIAKFDAEAGRWWDPRGPFAPLHMMNPARMAVLRRWLGPLEGARVLDVGCGGGLVSEGLARAGAAVTGLDASPQAIAVARSHAEEGRLDIAYRQGELSETTEVFDSVTALEVVEHVPDPGAFVAALAARVRPGGRIALSTVSRTAASYALAIVGAEYVARWVPPGTHDWRRFLRPSELSAHGRAAGLATYAVTGLRPDPLARSFVETRATQVNYMLCLQKPHEN